MPDIQTPNLAETIAETDAEIEDRKRQLAYQFWEDEGRPDGRAEAHWDRACLVLMSFEAGTDEAPGWLQRVPEPLPAITQSTQETHAASAGELASIEVLRHKIAARSAA